MAKFVEDGNKKLKACSLACAKLKKLMLQDAIDGVAEQTTSLNDGMKALRAVFSSILKIAKLAGHDVE